MKALRWHSPHHVTVDNVPDPTLQESRDVIVKVSLTAICGSDLHLYDGYIPAMKSGDILGHEFMGEVVEVGNAITTLKKGDRVTVPFDIACGTCHYCTHELFSLCDNSNPDKKVAEELYGYSGGGLFGYSHIYGGYAGGQAEFVRVPYADVSPLIIPAGISDEQALFLTDVFPTGYMAAENCNIQPDDVVAVFGCGPVGQFAIQSAYLLGASRVIAIDRVPERLAMARELGHAETIDYTEQKDIVQAIKDATNGRGPNAVIDAVGMEAHGTGVMGALDKARQVAHIESDRPTALRLLIQACGKGGTVSIPGVYGGFIDEMPMGAAFAKGLTFKMGQTHVQRYQKKLLQYIQDGKIDPSQIITHRVALADGPDMYKIFKEKKDNCIKVVMKP
ncbi:MAG: glutathione-dependent formaldehyde dehydrogenase [Ktedonobacterales bacterium]|nr:glutathione-dependent formaldehyde dehydrogenase [Ktedonobacterales bacterium]